MISGHTRFPSYTEFRTHAVFDPACCGAEVAPALADPPKTRPDFGSSGSIDLPSYARRYGRAARWPNAATSANVGVATTITYDTSGHVVRYDAATGDDTFVERDGRGRVPGSSSGRRRRLPRRRRGTSSATGRMASATTAGPRGPRRWPATGARARRARAGRRRTGSGATRRWSATGSGATPGSTRPAPEPKDVHLTGQLHHPISTPIHRALEKHRELRGLYNARDGRFVTRAIDAEAHKGYQKWHRNLDDEVVEWLTKNQTATPAQFETYLRKRYGRSDLRARFPDAF